MYFIKDAEGNMILVQDPKAGEKYLNANGEEIVCEAKAPAEPPAVPAVMRFSHLSAFP